MVFHRYVETDFSGLQFFRILRSYFFHVFHIKRRINFLCGCALVALPAAVYAYVY